MTHGLVSPHICTPEEQEVMVDHRKSRVPYQTGELKNVNMTGNILQLDFNYKIFPGVPIIVAHMFWGEIFIYCQLFFFSFNNFTSMKRKIFVNILSER